jgi:ribA/ribD-fused uncharacterized protein
MNPHYTIIGNYAFFWKGCLSQWWPSQYEFKEVTFNRAEQGMMYHKALLFNDTKRAKMILRSNSPKEQQYFGRQVTPFDEDIWNEHARKIVYRNNLAKFRQNPELRKILFETHPYKLVEASPFDAIWGIKRAVDFPKITDKSSWRGTNWLGRVLTKVRVTLMEEFNED